MGAACWIGTEESKGTYDDFVLAYTPMIRERVLKDHPRRFLTQEKDYNIDFRVLSIRPRGSAGVKPKPQSLY